MNEINKRIEVLEAELQKLKKEVKPKLKVGKWYKSEECIYFKGEYRSYGINGLNKWVEHDTISIGWDSYNFRLATDKEVEDALIKEAKKRGFKKGAKVVGMGTGSEILIDYEHEFIFYKDKNRLNYFLDIFRDGKWAEIVKEEVVKVGGYEVVKDGDYVKIGCKNIHLGLIKDLATLMKNSNFKKVAFDGVEVDIETIEKMLKM